MPPGRWFDVGTPGLGDVYMNDKYYRREQDAVAICEDCLEDDCPGHEDGVQCKNTCIVCGIQFSKFRPQYEGPEDTDGEPVCVPCMNS